MLDRLSGIIEKIKYINRKILSIDEKQLKSIELEWEISKQLARNEKLLLETKQEYQEYKEQFQYVNLEYLKIPRNMQKNYLLVGFYGAINLGDELMLQKLYSDFSDIKNNLYVMMCDNTDLDVFKYPGMNIIHYPKTKFDYNYLADIFDGVIFGGGAIIDDDCYQKKDSYQYDLGRIFVELSLAFLSKEKKVHAIGVSTNQEIVNNEYKEKLNYIINRSTSFSVRDQYSQKVLETIGKCRISLIQDVVLTHTFNYVPEVHDGKERIGIIWICQDNLRDNLIKLIEHINTLYHSNEVEIYLIPFYNYRNCDINFYKNICEFLRYDNIHVSEMSYSFREISERVNECNLIISMRYHGALLGLMHGRYTVALLYNEHKHYYNKMTDLFEKYRCGENLFTSIEQLKSIFPVSADKKKKENYIQFNNEAYNSIIKNIIKEVM